MNSPIHLLFAGFDGDDDPQILKQRAKSGQSEDWSSLKKAKKGDRALIYCVAPVSAIIATAELLENARPEPPYEYRTRLGKIRVLTKHRHIHLSEMREKFSNWGWPKAHRRPTYLDKEIGESLWQRAAIGDGRAVAVDRKIGAGFGYGETNPLVEQAAVKKVTRHLTGQGYRVISRELEKVGYDLDATKGEEVLHVEVKGVAGGLLQFPLTAREERCAGKDPAFRLFVVTGALGRTPDLHPFTGKQLLNRFVLTPLSYMASMRS